MSILDIKKTKKIYFISSLLVLLFSIIYEIFSHGVYSNYMIFAFLIPLIFGYLLFKIEPKVLKEASIISINLYHCLLSTITVGLLIKGFLDIYGTTNSLFKVYIILSIVLIILIIFFYKKKK